MAEHTIVGRLLDKPEERDAIHVAVASVTAGRGLRPGQHIGFEIDGGTERVSFDAAPLIGIVDPFLKRSVEPGERFWMFLYPNTITSLKHQWTHPAFGPEEKVAPQADAASEAWIRDFAEQYDITYNRMIEAAKGWLKNRAYLCGGSELEGERVPEEFWIHFERATGQRVDSDDRENFFTCSC